MRPHQCEHCGKYAKYGELDNYTPFGCANWASPEPYDPVIICSDCSAKLHSWYRGRFQAGDMSGDWVKSLAEINAAKEYELTWVGSFSISINGKKYHNEYIPNDLMYKYERDSKKRQV